MSRSNARLIQGMTRRAARLVQRLAVAGIPGNGRCEGDIYHHSHSAQHAHCADARLIHTPKLKGAGSGRPRACVKTVKCSISSVANCPDSLAKSGLPKE